MEVKIKQGEEMLDATIEMVNGVMVVSPKEVKFEPKEGDVVACERFGSIQLFICKKYEDECFCYCFYDSADESIVFDSSNPYSVERFATEEEKKKLFEKLAEEGYEFDFEKKELVKLKWKPKYKEPYFSPFFSNVDFLFSTCSHIYTEHFSDELTLKQTSVFKTEEECQEFCNRLNDAINSVKP